MTVTRRALLQLADDGGPTKDEDALAPETDEDAAPAAAPPRRLLLGVSIDHERNETPIRYAVVMLTPACLAALSRYRFAYQVAAVIAGEQPAELVVPSTACRYLDDDHMAEVPDELLEGLHPGEYLEASPEVRIGDPTEEDSRLDLEEVVVGDTSIFWRCAPAGCPDYAETTPVPWGFVFGETETAAEAKAAA